MLDYLGVYIGCSNSIIILYILYMINSWRFIRVGSKYSREIRYFLWNDNHRSKILPNKKCPQQNILHIKKEATEECLSGKNKKNLPKAPMKC